MQTPVPPPVVYKILRRSEWETLQAEGKFSGSPDDVRDGFIHLSCASQVDGTLGKHFDGEAGLVILTVQTGGLPIRMERSRGHEFFPHLYGDLPRRAVSAFREACPSDS